MPITGIIINPGTGPVGGRPTSKRARENMKTFCEDCKADPKTIRRESSKDDGEGRFGFTMTGQDGKTYQIDMPGLPLDRVRFTGAPEQNIWNYPRLYVDGNSWVWKFAVHMAGGPDEF